MKTKFYLKLLNSLLILVSSLFTLSAKAQSDFRFENAVLESGTALQTGAIYRFSNVRVGTDAIVTIMGFTNGATLDSFDRVSTGYQEAFQPIVRVPRRQNGYAEFKVDFVTAGTNTLVVQPSVSASPIDVDGEVLPGDTLFETDQLNLGGGLVDYDATTTQLAITTSGNWIIARNVGGIEYSGIDTNASAVRFTVTNSNISSLTLRMGEDNRSNNNRSRNRSVYFKKYSYSNSSLPALSLLSFRGAEKNKRVELQWELLKEHGLTKVYIERSNNNNRFEIIAEVWPPTDAYSSRYFRFNDNSFNGTVGYRLKMITANNKIEYSNILLFRENEQVENQFKIYPSNIETSATVSMKADKATNAVFQLVDYSGKIISQKNILLKQGNNSVLITDLGNIHTGNYVAVVKVDHKSYSQKVVRH